MSRLLYADFSRLIKNKLFWIGLIVMIALPLYAVGVRYYDYVVASETVWETADGLWFVGGMYMAIILSVVISLFIGTEFGEGTIRNKLMVGHTRNSIYFSKLLVCATVAIFYHITFIVILFGAGTLLLKSWNTPVETLTILTTLSVVTVIAMAAVFTMLAMLIHSRSAGAVTAMLVAMAMLISAVTIFSTLSAPEYIDNAYEMNEAGEIVKSAPIPNPRYLTGTKREVYQHMLNLIPVGQMMQFGNLQVTPQIYYLPLYAAIVVIVCTATGLSLFRRKDIR